MQEILERCLYPLMNEGLCILQEGVAQRASDIDVVWAAGCRSIADWEREREP
jgi:3-hydroxyacyl-CoA dehydrogenase